MGFTMGFLSGLALVSSTTYLTLLAHRMNRSQQSLSLRQQSTILSHIVDPPSAYTPRNTRRELYAATTLDERAVLSSRERGVVELAKDGWNRQIEGIVRNIENADYERIWAQAENVGARLWRSVSERVAQVAK